MMSDVERFSCSTGLTELLKQGTPVQGTAHVGLTPHYARLLMDPLVQRVTVALGYAHFRK